MLEDLLNKSVADFEAARTLMSHLKQEFLQGTTVNKEVVEILRETSILAVDEQVDILLYLQRIHKSLAADREEDKARGLNTLTEHNNALQSRV